VLSFFKTKPGTNIAANQNAATDWRVSFDQSSALTNQNAATRVVRDQDLVELLTLALAASNIYSHTTIRAQKNN